MHVPGVVDNSSIDLLRLCSWMVGSEVPPAMFCCDLEKVCINVMAVRKLERKETKTTHE